MENQSENKGSGLKHLLLICKDGTEGYKYAAANVDSTELKALLHTYSIQRNKHASDLKTCIKQAGGNLDNEEDGPLGGLHPAWVNIKTAFTRNDNKAILDACISREKAALEAYDQVITDGNLNAATKNMLISQRMGIRESLGNIEILDPDHVS